MPLQSVRRRRRSCRIRFHNGPRTDSKKPANVIGSPSVTGGGGGKFMDPAMIKWEVVVIMLNRNVFRGRGSHHKEKAVSKHAASLF
jgi:hypothetical protein